MKNYLLKIAFLSTLFVGVFMTSCSDDDSSDEEKKESTDPVLTDVCVFCREISGSQKDKDGQIEFEYFYPEGNVCKGEDGKAYLNGELQDELAELDTYEKYLESRERLGPPCTIVVND